MQRARKGKLSPLCLDGIAAITLENRVSQCRADRGITGAMASVLPA